MIDLSYILILSQKRFVCRSVKSLVEPDRSCRGTCEQANAARE